jgi:dethiobiotin synthetase
LKKYFVTGIGTGVGKTVASAILTEALKADYWKPIQAGNQECTDTDIIRKLISNRRSVIHPEKFRFRNALSPHISAMMEHKKISLKKLSLPATSNRIIIEGAGGVLVPLNNRFLIADLIKHLKADVILVSMNYLGSINHTLLTIESLVKRNIQIIGVIFNGEENILSEKTILKHSGLKKILTIKYERKITKKIVLKYSQMINYKFL